MVYRFFVVIGENTCSCGYQNVNKAKNKSIAKLNECIIITTKEKNLQIWRECSFASIRRYEQGHSLMYFAYYEWSEALKVIYQFFCIFTGHFRFVFRRTVLHSIWRRSNRLDELATVTEWRSNASSSPNQMWYLVDCIAANDSLSVLWCYLINEDGYNWTKCEPNEVQTWSSRDRSLCQVRTKWEPNVTNRGWKMKQNVNKMWTKCGRRNMSPLLAKCWCM